MRLLLLLALVGCDRTAELAEDYYPAHGSVRPVCTKIRKGVAVCLFSGGAAEGVRSWCVVENGEAACSYGELPDSMR